MYEVDKPLQENHLGRAIVTTDQIQQHRWKWECSIQESKRAVTMAVIKHNIQKSENLDDLKDVVLHMFEDLVIR